MSTRCQIEFVHIWKHGKKPYEEKRTVYRHSDGYPEGVIPDLKEFLKWNEGRNTDIEYAAANFIYWSKRRHEERYFKPGDEWNGNRKKWSDCGPTNCSILHIGFGVCNNEELHGDIAYFYRVIVGDGKITIKCYDRAYNGTYKQLVKKKPVMTEVIKTKEE